MPWYDGAHAGRAARPACSAEQTRLREQPLRLPIRAVNRAGELRRLRGHHRRRPRADAATPFASSLPGRLSRVARIAPAPTAISPRPAPGEPSRSRSKATVDVAPRRSDRARPTRPPRSPTSSRPRSSGWPTRRCCAAAATCCSIGAADRVTASITPLKYKINVSTLERMAATTLAHEGDRRLQPAASIARCRSIPTRSTATPAASS